MRLLCADDEEDIRTILQLALSLDPELEVELVDSGEAALARARTSRFDAIVLDGMMPGLDGYETCRRLKADPSTAGVPIVFLTAKTQRGEIERDLVSRDRGNADRSHQQAHHAEDAELQLVLHPDRRAEREHAPERPQVE